MVQHRILCFELVAAACDLRAAAPDLSQHGFIALLEPVGAQPLQVGSVCLKLGQLAFELGAAPLELRPFSLSALLPPRRGCQVTLRGSFVHPCRLDLRRPR